MRLLHRPYAWRSWCLFLCESQMSQHRRLASGLFKNVFFVTVFFSQVVFLQSFFLITFCRVTDVSAQWTGQPRFSEIFRFFL
jgi:hypothetical protein